MEMMKSLASLVRRCMAQLVAFRSAHEKRKAKWNEANGRAIVWLPCALYYPEFTMPNAKCRWWRWWYCVHLYKQTLDIIRLLMHTEKSRELEIIQTNIRKVSCLLSISSSIATYMVDILMVLYQHSNATLSNRREIRLNPSAGWFFLAQNYFNRRRAIQRKIFYIYVLW